MIEILNTVIPVFLIIAIGFVIGKKRKIDVQPIVDLIIYIAGPSLIFVSLAKSNIELNDFLTMVIVTVVFTSILWLLAYIIFKITKSKNYGLYLPMAHGNTGYLGWPIALFAFGIAGLSRAVIFDAVASVFLFSLGIYVVHRRNELKEIFKIPLIYALILGFLFNFFKIPVPKMAFSALEMIGMITIPAALLVLGYKLTEIKLKSAKIAFLASLFKIGIGFLVAFLIVALFSITGITRDIILLEASMPSAVFTMILCQKYKRDAALVASTVLISTIISIFTIPLILSIL